MVLNSMLERILSARNKTRDWLLNQQHPEGYWVAELQGDTILETEYAIYLHYMGWGDPETYRLLANYVLTLQNEQGGWGIYPGAPTDISATVKCYILLKLAGHSLDSEPMTRARAEILSHGGITKV